MVFIRKAALLAMWSALCMALPSLAVVSPAVKPAIDHVVKSEQPSPATAMRYDDGRAVAGAKCDLPAGVALQQQSRAVSQDCTRRPVGWWQRGPVRRWIAGGPIRRFFARRRWR